MKKTLVKLFFISGICFANSFFAQENKPTSSVTGNFQIDAANYTKDTTIGADPGSQVVRYNSFGNVNYSYGNFTAGVRFESYQPPLLGYLPGYTGTGIPYKYARYKHDNIDVTVGSFYDQFGSGMCFRSYEDRGLLYDNAMNGMRVIFYPKNGITLKGFIGKQRTYFDLSPGVVRGVDGEVNITQLFNDYREGFAKNDTGGIDSARYKRPLKTQVILGGSFVSKYQQDQDPNLILPENVGCSAARLNIIRGGFNFYAEGAYKINDPSYQNNFSYKDGKGLFASASYAANSGLTFLVTGKMIDNMSFRSDRNATNTIDMINYSPAITKNHTYMMMAYVPYASQMNGEVGASGEIQYKFKKGTFLGGKYGMDVTLNGSIMYAPDTTGLPRSQDSTRQYKYKVNYMSVGKEYFHDINIEIGKKINKHLKFTFMYANQYINQARVQYNTENKKDHPDVHSHIIVADVTWRYKTGKAIRFEGQTFQTKDTVNAYGAKSWVTGLIEWTPSSNWFVVVADQLNYNNADETKRVHYYYGSLIYVSGPTRITLSYGRQRAGIFCAGGVCRFVPSANALTISVSTSF
ncbi:MAG TPA: DUF6029 family protein [Bacteroidia bacterium]|nr:DUF6029 family protein [Bacteroidia bacterium]